MRMTRCWQSAIFLIAAVIAMAAGAQPYPKFESRAAATAALSAADAGKRLGAVIYFGRNGVAGDGPLLVKRLADEDPIVREAAQQAVWLAWSRSGDAETDRLLNDGTAEMSAGHYPKAIEIFSKVIKRDPAFAEGWNKRATAYYLAGNLRKSLADCDEVMKRNPQHFGALSGYGLMASNGAADLLADHVSGRPLPPYAAAFRLDRYDDPAYRALLAEWGDSGQL